jgi:hypothetical protein
LNGKRGGIRAAATSLGERAPRMRAPDHLLENVLQEMTEPPGRYAVRLCHAVVGSMADSTAF